MVEALACGTPILAFPKGAVSEIVIDGENGFHVADEQEMAQAISRLDSIDPLRCRESVASRYDAAIVAESYEALYERAIAASPQRTARFERNGQAAPPGCDTTDALPRRGRVGRGLPGTAASAIDVGAGATV
jgi:hypothetical protein